MIDSIVGNSVVPVRLGSNGWMPAVFDRNSDHSSGGVVLSAANDRVRLVSGGIVSALRSSWIKLPGVISPSPVGSFVRPRPCSSPPASFLNKSVGVPMIPVKPEATIGMPNGTESWVRVVP